MKKPSLSIIIFLSLAISACDNPMMKDLLDPKTVYFDSNGGSHVPSKTIIKGEKLSEPETPVKAGYSFFGWFEDNNTFNKRWYFNREPDGDMTLYASWFLNAAQPQYQDNLTPVASDFNIGDALTFTYDGLSKTVTIEPKTGKSQGTITVYYNGNTAPPVNIGTYIVTFDVAPAEGWYAANGLSAGTLTIIAPNPDYQTPIAEDYTISGIGTFVYDGSAKAVTVTPYAGKSQGTIVIKYNGSITAPTNAATYAVTFDVSVADGWNSATGLSAGTLTINKATPSIEDFYFGGAGTFDYDSNAKTVTITPITSIPLESITVKYNDDTTAPTNVGTYPITFDVAESTNWNAVHGLYAGTLTINKGTLTANNFNISGLTQTYDGNAKTVTITPMTGYNIPNGITVNYGNSTTAPTNAGNYTVTFNVAESSNWNAASGLEAGTLVIYINSVDGLQNFLLDLSTGTTGPGRDPSNPITIPLKVNDLADIGDVLNSVSNVYVNLDLSSSTFTSVPAQAFNECINLIGVTLPDTVTSIGDNAFHSCFYLTSITLPINSGFTKISNSTFLGCARLESVTIPNSVTSIGSDAFCACISLTSVTIPDSVASIGDIAFFECYSLTNVTFEGTITTWPTNNLPVFDGNLQTIYNGPGTYTRQQNSDTWTKTSTP